MIRKEIENLIKKAIKAEFGQIKMPEIEVTKPEVKELGDYSTNISLQICRSGTTRISTRKNAERLTPIKVAEILVTKIKDYKESSGLFEKINIGGPGFINFYLSQEYLQSQVGKILKEGEKFGPPKFPSGKLRRVNIEFISANPTGPLTLGNGRGAFFGDVLSNVLTKAGYKIEREYYINDIGEQIRKLGHSVLADEQAVYRGKYIEDLRKKIKGDSPEKVGEKAAMIIIKENIKPFIDKKLKMHFNTWFSEKKLHQSGEVDKIIKFLEKKDLAYKKDDALWFKSSQFGDDKDRVLVKADGEKTYLASDIAYLKDKFNRGFDKLIYIWGADHYGYISRIKAAAKALGYDPEKVKIIIMQLVRLIESGKEVRMSKRTGTFVTLEELVDEVGLDVARFFFLMHSANSHMNFDLALAKERSEKNPVFYVQYAHARICSILRKCKMQNAKIKMTNQDVRLLKEKPELELIKQLVCLPEVVEDTARDYQVQRLPNYALELVTAFHKFYEQCRVIGEEKKTTQARLGLIQATKIVLKNILDLMGIAAPEKM